MFGGLGTLVMVTSNPMMVVNVELVRCSDLFGVNAICYVHRTCEDIGVEVEFGFDVHPCEGVCNLCFDDC